VLRVFKVTESSGSCDIHYIMIIGHPHSYGSHDPSLQPAGSDYFIRLAGIHIPPFLLLGIYFSTAQVTSLGSEQWSY